MPVGIGYRLLTCFIEARYLFGCKNKVRRSQIVAQLLFIACPDDHAQGGQSSRTGWPCQDPSSFHLACKGQFVLDGRSMERTPSDWSHAS
jgi:hypothetical protein